MREGLRQIEARIIEAASQIDSATSQLLIDLRRFDDEKGWRDRGAISCLHWLTSQLGWDRATASERIRVARRLAALPQADAAYLAGAISYSKVRALVRVATPENEETLLAHARRCTAAELERICRRWRVGQTPRNGPDVEGRRRIRRRSLDDGAVKFEGVFDAGDAEVVWEALRVAAASAGSSTRDFIVGLARGFLESLPAETGNAPPATTRASDPVRPVSGRSPETEATPRKPKGKAAARVDVSPRPGRLPAKRSASSASASSTRRAPAAKAVARSPDRRPSEPERASVPRRARRAGNRDGP